MTKAIALTSALEHAFNSFFIVRGLIAKSLAGAYDVAPSTDDCDLQIHVGAPDDSARELWAHRRRPVAFFAFVESATIPAAWIETLNSVDYVLAPSRFCYDVLKASGVTTPTWLVPLGLDLDDEPPLGPDRRGATFTVMWQGVRQAAQDADGRLTDGDRKRGYLVEQAFLAADLPGSRLILKSFPAEGEGRDLRGQHIWRIETPLTPDQIRELDSQADVFVWPTRGEGYGLLPLEKLSRGVPVAVTGWSGVTDYLADFPGAAIDDFQLTDVIYNHAPTQMADVPLEAVVERLRWAHANLPTLRASRTTLAETARRNWNFRTTTTPPLLACLREILGD